MMAAAPSKPHKPEILAPAGNRDAFLAALAAGADAVYCGLKSLSARMTAPNFTVDELCRLTRLARNHGTRVYVTLNTLVKSSELDGLSRLLDDLNRRVRPDGLIIQDLALVNLAEQMGLDAEIHLSTLANVSFPDGLRWVHEGLRVDRVVVPRELNIDEIKSMAERCPDGLSLEVFVHGALCYAVSGRCYWSSLLGGKSGLRGRCVQPCRRQYAQSGQKQRMFACRDLSLDVLVKTLRSIPRIRAWKIEGRKKGAHYVYHTVSAYRMLRDLDENTTDRPGAKKAALSLLAQALGRAGTHYHFLPQRPQDPVDPDGPSASGLMVGVVKGPSQRRYLSPRIALWPGDVLRIGYEDDRWHQRLTLHQSIPARGRFQLKSTARRTPPNGIPVFLVDRSDQAVYAQLAGFNEQLAALRCPAAGQTGRGFKAPAGRKLRRSAVDMRVFRRAPRQRQTAAYGLWLPERVDQLPAAGGGKHRWWWLSPALWPDSADELPPLIESAVKGGAAGFVLNAPWQAALFADIKTVPIWAGPFCNVTNELVLATLARLGFNGAIVSPELGRGDLLHLPALSPIPLGIVMSGHWPFCIARRTSRHVQPRVPFTSPRAETAWMVEYGGNDWIYPNWPLDLRSMKKRLLAAGYHWLIHLVEPRPEGVPIKKRPGLWNWDVGLA